MLRIALMPVRAFGAIVAVVAWIAFVPLLELARVLRLRARGYRPEPALDLELDAS